MYDSPQQQSINQVDIKKMASNNSSVNGNNTNANGVNNGNNTNQNSAGQQLQHNGLIVNKQQGQLHLSGGNKINNLSQDQQ